MPRRSWLFVPANREGRVAKAFATNADVVIMDLEDACPEAEKEAAREIVAHAASEHGGARCFVRMNAARTRFALGDLESVVVPGLAGIVIPKAERVSDLQAIDWALEQLEQRRGLAAGAIEIVPLVETALGVCELSSIARCGLPRIRQLTFGAGDLTTDLGIRWTRDEGELATVRASIVTASRAGGLEPPIDTVWPGIADTQGLTLSLNRTREAGFAGKLIIHPSQIDPTNSTLAPTPEEVAFAHRVLEAAVASEAAGQGAFQLDGRLMDNVSVVRARRTIASHGEEK
ncbi:MAG: CoA ester lyase [Pseudomonadota bacterium]|nr:CoA ester lyase [Pseudomonadota bacterium]